MLKILFVGSKNMGAENLKVLHELAKKNLLKIEAVIARWDDDEDNWYKSVSKLSKELGYKTYMPENINSREFVAELANIEYDLGICCFYPKLFKKRLINLPKLGFINLHFAPLPMYRGALPIPHAIINGEKMHGVTIHKINQGMDNGEILGQKFFPIFACDTGAELYKRCEYFGTHLFCELIKEIVNIGTLPISFLQDTDKIISFTKKDNPSMELDIEQRPQKIYNFVRAFDFYPFTPPHLFINNSQYFCYIKPENHGINRADCLVYVTGEHTIYLKKGSA